MSSIKSLFILFSLLASSCAPTKQEEAENLTAYDVLQQYGFPVGLLPKGVIGYALNKETGEFAVYMNGTCSFDIQGYSLKYKSTITGVISQNKLSKLKGISVKVLILWLNIVEVRLEGNDIQFSVGIASADFGVDNFLESPQCGCGFACSSSGSSNSNNLPLNGDVSLI